MPDLLREGYDFDTARGSGADLRGRRPDMSVQSNAATVYVIPVHEDLSGKLPRLERIVYEDLSKSEDRLEQLLAEGILSPAGKPWLCVLPTEQHDFFSSKDEAELWSFGQGFEVGHFVVEFVLND